MLSVLCKINRDTGMFVTYHHGEGYCCLSFAVERERTTQLWNWLRCQLGYRLPEITRPIAEPGTEEAWHEYGTTLHAAERFCRTSGQACPMALRPQLVGFEGCRVEVHDGEYARRFWSARSAGWLPIHLELSRHDSAGGPPVLGPIVRVCVLRDDRKANGFKHCWGRKA